MIILLLERNNFICSKNDFLGEKIMSYFFSFTKRNLVQIVNTIKSLPLIVI